MGTMMMLDGQAKWADCADRPQVRSDVVLVVEDRPRLSRTVGYICDFLNLPMETAGGNEDLATLLDRKRPLAVICELEGVLQDGCHVMKTVAKYDATLPIMLITGSDQTLIGAADAVEEIWGLSRVSKLRDAPGLGDVVEFLCRSGQVGGSSSLRSA